MMTEMRVFKWMWCLMVKVMGSLCVLKPPQGKDREDDSDERAWRFEVLWVIGPEFWVVKRVYTIWLDILLMEMSSLELI